MSSRRVFHLLPNAHLDPVWLWDWREGLNEGLITVRGVLALMDEFPELTFIRGETSIYEHLERTDRATFDRVVRMVEAGRWDVVGGTYVQPDSNLPSGEGLCRQFEVGLAYCRSRFGAVPTVAWQADCFGHTPGWPTILAAFGMRGFAFTRPQQREFPLGSPVFRWRAGGQSVLCYRQHWRWYCSERGGLPAVLDETYAKCQADASRHAAVFFGLGNHGGGPSRRQIRDIALWAVAHPDIEVRYSTLHGFFAALEADLPTDAVPEVEGDLGFCLRGCYSSSMRLKGAHRRAEAALLSAEATQAAVGKALGIGTVHPLGDAWKGSLFNAFHDILPGSSIERALDDQLALAGAVLHAGQAATFEALNQLAARVDTSVPAPRSDDAPADAPVLVWNPLPRRYDGWVEIEAALDYRPLAGVPANVGSLPLRLTGPDGECPVFQEIATEHRSMRDAAWRKRVLFRTTLPALGWKVFRLGFDLPATSPAPEPPRAPLDLDGWRVSVNSDGLLDLQLNGRRVLGGDGLLRVLTVEDPWGSWGGMDEEAGAINTEAIRDAWRVTDHRLLEQGPERAVLWTLWDGGRSRLDLHVSALRGTGHLRLKGRLLLAERSARVKMVLPSAGPLEMQVPAAVAIRAQQGHLPCGRWVRAGDGAVGFVSDVLSDVDHSGGEVRFTLARASRYADDVPTASDECPWVPAMDAGELKFELWIVPGGSHLEDLAETLLHPPVTLPVPAHPGEWPAQDSLAELEPAGLRLLALRAGEHGDTTARIQNATAAECSGTLRLHRNAFPTGTLAPWEIRTLSSPPA